MGIPAFHDLDWIGENDGEGCFIFAIVEKTVVDFEFMILWAPQKFVDFILWAPQKFESCWVFLYAAEVYVRKTFEIWNEKLLGVPVRSVSVY